MLGHTFSEEVCRYFEEKKATGSKIEQLVWVLIQYQNPSRDYSEMTKVLDALVAENFSDAMVSRANMHRDAQGGPEDYPEAIRLINDARSLGNSSASLMRANMHRGAKGVPQNYSEAIRLVNDALIGGLKKLVNKEDWITFCLTVAAQQDKLLIEEIHALLNKLAPEGLSAARFNSVRDQWAEFSELLKALTSFCDTLDKDSSVEQVQAQLENCITLQSRWELRPETTASINSHKNTLLQWQLKRYDLEYKGRGSLQEFIAGGGCCDRLYFQLKANEQALLRLLLLPMATQYKVAMADGQEKVLKSLFQDIFVNLIRIGEGSLVSISEDLVAELERYTEIPDSMNGFYVSEHAYLLTESEQHNLVALLNDCIDVNNILTAAYKIPDEWRPISAVRNIQAERRTIGATASGGEFFSTSASANNCPRSPMPNNENQPEAGGEQNTQDKSVEPPLVIARSVENRLAI